ncbi:MAG: gamma-glutamyl-gamma-aminobutyrate hydrolase family protein [Planctomycetes bacterium]|nr:gamma-glutamyl-gamma-aminobutyrate hydrolase family protein [Planctomycetota bacterium]
MKRTLLLIAIAGMILQAGCQIAPQAPKPLIGITSVYRTNNADADEVVWCNFSYVRAVAENGGVPVVLPTLAGAEIIHRYVSELDGLVLVGGADIPPEAYGEKPHETVVAMGPERFHFESKLIPLWLATGKPTLGVCLGMQFTNVSLGGNLIQDIPSQVGTEVNHRGKGDYHVVNIEPASRLAKTLGTTQAKVYSNHHQAVKDLADGFRIVARSADGVPEAMERIDGRFGLFVQWHPELMKTDTAHRDAIYGALVQACAGAQ